MEHEEEGEPALLRLDFGMSVAEAEVAALLSLSCLSFSFAASPSSVLPCPVVCVLKDLARV